MKTIKHMDSHDRAVIGRSKEVIVSDILQNNGFVLQEASQEEDYERKIDRWIINPASKKKEGLSIKFREKYFDICFEVFSKFEGFGEDNLNRIGRDMISQANYLAVLFKDNSVVVAKTQQIKSIVKDMIDGVLYFGWTKDYGHNRPKVLNYTKNGAKCLLKYCSDPCNPTKNKMLAIIPPQALDDYQLFNN